MRIHSDTLTRQDFVNAARRAGVSIVELSEHGSRSRARAFNFSLSGSASHWRNDGRYGANTDDKAATWDEWGIVFAHLFNVDPQAHCRAYLSADHFHWATGDRFRTLTPLLQHKRHKWEPALVAQSYAESWCDCGATHRLTYLGHKWEEISA